MGSVCSTCSKAIFGDKSSLGYKEIPSNDDAIQLGSGSNSSSMKDESTAPAVPIPVGASSQTNVTNGGSTNASQGKKKVGFSEVGQGLSMYSAYAPKQSEDKSFFLKYSLGEEIGSGSTSKCYRCTRKSDSKAFAVKIIDKNAPNLNIKQCLVEIRILTRIKHANIVDMADHYETNDKIYMVLELLEGGELFDYVVEKGTLSEDEAKSIVKSIISAVATLHSNNIMHRDLKPENILLTKKGAGAEVKLIDFGLSKEIEEKVSNTFLGTKGYLAPEMLQRTAYGKAVDVWALGIIVFVLLCGCLPFSDEIKELQSDREIKKNFELRIPPWASDISVPAKDFMHTLLETDPKKRVTAEQSLAHHWFIGSKQLTKNVALQSPKILRKDFKSPSNGGMLQQALRGFDAPESSSNSRAGSGSEVYSSNAYYNNSSLTAGNGPSNTNNRQINYSVKSQRAIQDDNNLSTSF